jgi:hypothetical protein
MKGIAHFATGLCVASFVPGVVESAAVGGLLIALGGASGMLPDLFDFRFAKFLERRDADIAPDPSAFDGQSGVGPIENAAAVSSARAIANAIAREIGLARAGTVRTIQLHPLRRGVVDWVTYAVSFDHDHGEVIVNLEGAEARSRAGAMDYAYDGSLEVGELGGPSLQLHATGAGEGCVRIEFLPWHRQWSHSLTLALALGLAAAAVLGPAAGCAAALGYAAHVLEDQLGYLGSNLFWPFTRRRFDGLGLLHSGDAIPNALTVWLSLSLLLLNLDRQRDVPLIAAGPFLAFAVALPAIALVAIYARRKWRGYVASLQVDRNREAVAEGVDRAEQG